MRHLYAIALSLLVYAFAYPAQAEITCATVKWAMATLPAAQIAEYRAKATPEQIALAKKCLAGKSDKGQKVTKKTSKKVKKATKHLNKKPIPLPRPAPLPKVEIIPESLLVVNQPAAQPDPALVNTPDPGGRKMPKMIGWLEVFAFIGLLALTFAVGKWGLIPVWNWIKTRAAAGKQVEIEVWNHIVALERQVEALTKKKTVELPIAPPPSAGGTPTPGSPLVPPAA